MKKTVRQKYYVTVSYRCTYPAWAPDLKQSKENRKNFLLLLHTLKHGFEWLLNEAWSANKTIYKCISSMKTTCSWLQAPGVVLNVWITQVTTLALDAHTSSQQDARWEKKRKKRRQFGFLLPPQSLAFIRQQETGRQEKHRCRLATGFFPGALAFVTSAVEPPHWEGGQNKARNFLSLNYPC